MTSADRHDESPTSGHRNPSILRDDGGSSRGSGLGICKNFNRHNRPSSSNLTAYFFSRWPPNW